MGNTATSVETVWGDEEKKLDLTLCSSMVSEGEDTTAATVDTEKMNLLESVMDYDVRIARIRSELEEIRSKRSLELSQFLVDKAELERVMQLSRNKYWEVMKKSSVPKLASPPSIYKESIREARKLDESFQSHYVTSLEAQLCRASHVMGTFMYQLSLARVRYEALFAFLKAETVQEADDTTRIEVKLLNEIYAADTENKLIKEKYITTIEEQKKETSKLSLRIAAEEKEKSAHESDQDSAQTQETQPCDDHSGPHEEATCSTPSIVQVVLGTPPKPRHVSNKLIDPQTDISQKLDNCIPPLDCAPIVLKPPQESHKPAGQRSGMVVIRV